MIRKTLLFCCLLIAYGGLFHHQERLSQDQPLELAFPLSAGIQKVALGYLRQLGGEMLFIKANVFLGGAKPGRNPYDYAESLTKHLDGAANLHPPFIDTYFLCNASLPDIGPEYALEANRILEKGMTAMPKNVLWPFFAGFNYFYHLNQPIEAARFLKIASEIPTAPSWLGHLASTLAAKGGDIKAGVIWLRGMVATEEDEKTRERYQQSLAIFEQAANVQQAIEHYTANYGQPPPDLPALVPEFLPALPDTGKMFELLWDGKSVKLIRLDIRAIRIVEGYLYINYLSQPSDYRTGKILSWPKATGK